MNPKISVVIPVYNGSRFIGRGIRSALRQTYPAHEIVVVNDGSTDNTLKVLDGFSGGIRVKTIPHSGCAHARNEGIRTATGDYIAFLDADDVWFRWKLVRVADFIRRYPEVGLFTSNYLVYSDLHGRLVRHYRFLSNRGDFNFDEPLKDDFFRLLLRSNFIGTPSAVVAKKTVAVDAGLFDPSYRIVEDLEFFFRLAARTNAVVIRNILLYKRKHAENMSGNKIAVYQSHLRVLENTIHHHEGYIRAKRLSAHCRLALAGIDYILGDLFFDAGRKKEAFGAYVRGFTRTFSPSNIAAFFWVVIKKSFRLASLGLMSRKNWLRLRGLFQKKRQV